MGGRPDRAGGPGDRNRRERQCRDRSPRMPDARPLRPTRVPSRHPGGPISGGGSPMKLQGKCAVVTGAGNGIGQAVAVELAERGAGAVALVDRNETVIRDRADDQRPDGRADRRGHDRRHDGRSLPGAGLRSPVRQARCAADLRAGGRDQPRPARRQARQVHRPGRDVSGRPVPAPGRGQPDRAGYWAMEMVARIAEERQAARPRQVGARGGDRKAPSSSSGRSPRRASRASSRMPRPRPRSRAPRGP